MKTTARKPKRLTNEQLIRQIMQVSPLHQILVVDAVSKLALAVAAADAAKLDNPLIDGESYKRVGADIIEKFKAQGYMMEPKAAEHGALSGQDQREPVRFEVGEYFNRVSEHPSIVPGAVVRVTGAGPNGCRYHVVSRNRYVCVIRQIKEDGSGLYAAQSFDASLLTVAEAVPA